MRRQGSGANSKVTFVLPSYSIGGAELQLATLIANRPTWAQPVTIETITFLEPTSTELSERFEALGVENVLIDRGSLGFVPFFLKLVRHLRKSRPNVVHTFLDSSTGTWGRLAALAAGRRNIMHSDRSLMVGDTGVHRVLRPLLDRATSSFLPNAGAIALRLQRSGVPPHKIVPMTSAVDLSRFYERDSRAAREAWNIGEDAVVAGFLGRFAPVKRLDILLDSLLLVPEALRPDFLVMAGDGSEMAYVQARLKEDAWLRDHVITLGTSNDTPAFLAGVDYLVLSSEIEGAPNAVLEAMAMGKPIVATNVSDLPEIVDSVGFLAEAADAASLSEAIAAMQRLSPAERRELGTRARARIVERYDIAAVAARFWEAHRRFLKADGRRLDAPGGEVV